MSVLACELEIRELIREYLSVLDEAPRFLRGAYTKVSGGRLCIEHDEGWVFAGRPDGPLVVSSYGDDDAFNGAAGLEALLDWLRP